MDDDITAALARAARARADQLLSDEGAPSADTEPAISQALELGIACGIREALDWFDRSARPGP